MLYTDPNLCYRQTPTYLIGSQPVLYTDPNLSYRQTPTYLIDSQPVIIGRPQPML